MRNVFRPYGGALIALALYASPAVAGPVTPGTLTPITLEGGGTISGSLTFDAALTTVTDWNIVETGGTFGGFDFQAFTFTKANSSVLFDPTFDFGGRTLSTLDIRSNDYNSNTFGAHDLGLFFEQIPATIPATGAALQICSPTGISCNDPLFTSIRSGEFVRTPSASAPLGVAIREVTSGYFTISDPPNSFIFNFSLQPVLIPVDGGDGGGGGTDTETPEPATLSLLAMGSALAMGARNRRKTKV